MVGGNSLFNLEMLVTVLVYAEATGMIPSRRIARRLEEDVRMWRDRALAADGFRRIARSARLASGT